MVFHCKVWVQIVAAPLHIVSTHLCTAVHFSSMASNMSPLRTICKMSFYRRHFKAKCKVWPHSLARGLFISPAGEMYCSIHVPKCGRIRNVDWRIHNSSAKTCPRRNPRSIFRNVNGRLCNVANTSFYCAGKHIRKSHPALCTHWVGRGCSLIDILFCVGQIHKPLFTARMSTIFLSGLK